MDWVARADSLRIAETISIVRVFLSVTRLEGGLIVVMPNAFKPGTIATPNPARDPPFECFDEQLNLGLREVKHLARLAFNLIVRVRNRPAQPTLA